MTTKPQPLQVGDIVTTPIGRRAQVVEVDLKNGEATVRLLADTLRFRFVHLRREGDGSDA
jgi:hypothetical protein